ncbi:MAG: ATP-binding cassette domain-containing protein [Pseudomonadota bacterium]
MTLKQEPPVTSQQPAIVQLKDVSLTLPSRAGNVEILRQVSMTVHAGETVAIVGPSGSGKTSLMMIMAGLEPATSGAVKVAGESFVDRSEDDLALLRAHNIGIVFQSFHLVPTMTALENIALPLEFRGDADAFQTGEALLQKVGLGHRAGHYPAQLSGGEQQRVALARAVAIKPRLVLADEPTGNLDGETGRQVVDLLFGLGQATETTLVLITHDERLANRCQRIVRMADGQISSEETAAAA